MSTELEISPPVGIRRIQKACLNCRRKKAKCSGHRPMCRLCSRLSQDCMWDDNEGQQRGKREISEVSSAEQRSRSQRQRDNSLTSKMTAVEDKLNGVLNVLNTQLPSLAQRRSPDDARQRESGVASESVEAAVLDTSPRHSLTQRTSFLSFPPQEELHSLIDIYFLRVHNQPYALFHERKFRQRLANGTLPDSLVFAVLATALRFSASNYFMDQIPRAMKVYASNSWKQLLSTWLEDNNKPDIYICQTIMLLGLIDYAAGNVHSSWLKIGLSIRVAQDLRLMVEPDPGLSFEDQEERRRVFWSIYILDKFISCGKGHPAAITDAQCRVQLPSSESEFRAGKGTKTPILQQGFDSSSALYENKGHLALLVLMASTASRTARNTIHEHSMDSSRPAPWDPSSKHASMISVLSHLKPQLAIGSSLEHFLKRDCLHKGSIDMHIAVPAILSQILFHTSQCLLNHPFLLYQQSVIRHAEAPICFLEQAQTLCWEHACLTTQVLYDAQNLGCMLSYSFAGYAAVVSASLHILFTQSDVSTIRKQATEYLQYNRSFLGGLMRYWQNATHMLTLLTNLEVHSASFRSLLDTPPDLTRLDSAVLEWLWTSVDYPAMSYASGPLDLSPAVGCPQSDLLRSTRFSFTAAFGGGSI